MSQKNTAIVEADRRGYHCDQDGNIYNPKGKAVKSYPNGNGYLAFSLRMGKNVISIPVHRFVAFQIHGQTALFEQLVIRHLDNDKANNSWGNIAFGTSSENAMDLPKQQRIEQATHAANCRWQSAA